MSQLEELDEDKETPLKLPLYLHKRVKMPLHLPSKVHLVHSFLDFIAHLNQQLRFIENLREEEPHIGYVFFTKHIQFRNFICLKIPMAIDLFSNIVISR